MNIRELWDTVVLRDILGFILPGALTLLAAALMMTGVGLKPPELIARVLQPLGLNEILSQEHWLPWHPPFIMVALVALSYVAGHVQNEVIAYAQEHLPGCSLGALTVRLFRESPMGHNYCRAALDIADERDRGQFEDLCSTPPLDPCKQQIKKARDLLYWCNYYVQKEAAEIHATWVGRYYVLTVLFSNLVLSSFLLAFGALVAVVQSLETPGPAVSLIVASLILAVLAFAWVSRRFKKAYIEWTFQIYYALLAEKRSDRRSAATPDKKNSVRSARRTKWSAYGRRR